MIQHSELPAGTAAAPAQPPFHDHDARVRAMLFCTASTEVCISSFRKNSRVLYVESPYVLLNGQIRKIVRNLFQHARRLGWDLPAENDLDVMLNGRKIQHFARPRTQHHLEGYVTLVMESARSAPFLLCVAGVDGGLDGSVRKYLNLIAEVPDEGIDSLLANTLRQREDYETLFAAMIDGVILCDENMGILFINDVARKLIGLSIVPRRGTPLQPTALCDLQEILGVAIDDGISQMNKVVKLGQQAKRLLGVNVQQVSSRRGNAIGWLLILRDITASWQSDRFKSMLTVASHELNTPLASMRNTLDLLIDEETGPASPAQKKYLTILRHDVDRMRRLLYDMLDLSKLEETNITLDRRRHVRIEFVAKRVLESFDALAESRGIRLKSRIASGVPSFIGDRDRVTQVLMNLIDNAIKYTPLDGEIIIDCIEDKTELVVSVADNGIGIPREKADAIFERFAQLDNLPAGVRRGFGLGLSIAREIVTSMGGRIWVKSELKKGSTFLFTIPLTAANPSREAEVND